MTRDDCASWVWAIMIAVQLVLAIGVIIVVAHPQAQTVYCLKESIFECSEFLQEVVLLILGIAS